MNWLDLVIVIIVGVSAFMGLKIGLIRAGLTALGVFVGSMLGGQLSDDIGRLFSGIDEGSAVATVISYAIIIMICLTAAAAASVVLRKVVSILLMGWADKLAGVALGLVAGAVISAGIIMGMANLTYSSEVGDELATKVLNSTLDTEKAKKRLEDGLTQSALVTAFVDVVEIVPSSTLWFVPTNFKSALNVLNQRQSPGGG
ncbi:MAG: CvpA family protein [Chloroflexi bacterium]|nr:CvpA family protein [Chloroflexota bacterium]MCH8893131.1 CvpA family protein [Chloroflexota bacterium]MCH9017394.1 CvpA family protein [Chloroflexota bacterium]MCI0789401.1 CvpA family protein [Chloroflexota bacterium]MCI0810894.1 CvpA family protein [Chloroflexota bacterium]